MNISSLNALSNNNICFDKWDRSNSFVAQCMRKFSGKNIPINYILAVKEQELITVSCKELTCWNFLLKFLGLGPLAKMDLHLAEVSKLLNKNWQVIQAEIATSASLSEDLAKTKQRQTILKNIEQVFQKCQQSKKGIVPSNWQSDIEKKRKELKPTDDLFNQLERLCKGICENLNSTLIEQIPKKVALLNNQSLFQLLDRVSDSLWYDYHHHQNEFILKYGSNDFQKVAAEKINRLLEILFSDDLLLLALLKEKKQASHNIGYCADLIRLNSKKDLFEKLQAYQSVIHHELFKRIGDFQLKLQRFLFLEKYYTNSTLLDQFLDLPDLFFADPSWIKEFLMEKDLVSFNEALIKLLKDKPELLPSLKNLPSSLLTPEMIKQLPAMAKAFVNSWGSRKAIVKHYCKTLSAEEAAAFKLKVGIVQDNFEYQGVENFRFLFTLIAAPKEHFDDIRALFAPLIQELEKEGKEIGDYATLISLIIEKPLKEQRSWAEAFITSIADKPEIRLDKHIEQVRKFSLQEFEELVKFFEEKACFNTIFSKSFGLFQFGQKFPFEALAILEKIDPSFDLDIVFCNILIRWNLADFKNLQEKQCFIENCQYIVQISQEIKTIFPQMEKEHYNLIFKRLIEVRTYKTPAEECKRALQWLRWSSELFEEKAWELFKEKSLPPIRGDFHENVELSSWLFLGKANIFKELQESFAGFMDKSLVERQQDMAPFLDLYRIACGIRAYYFFEENEEEAKARLAAFGKILADVRFYKVPKEDSFAFDSAGFLEVVGKEPCLEQLQEILSGNNEKYNLLIQKWQAIEEELSEKTDHCRRPKSARSANI